MPGWLRAARALGLVSFVGFLIASLLVWSARWSWVGEIAASFAWHLGLSGFAGAVALALVRRWRLAIITLVIATLHAGPELALFMPDTPAAPGEATSATLVVANCNLLWDNTDYDGFRAWLRANEPDVVACQEVSPGWRKVLESLVVSYPHLLLSPADGWDVSTWGTAVLSRLAFEKIRLIPTPSGKTRPSIEVVVRWDERPITIRSAHPMRPGRPWRLEMRNEVLSILANQHWDGAGVLLGDLNVTSTSPVFTAMLAASGLRDYRQGFGRQPTWTTNRMIHGLSVAIDHVLVGPKLRVVHRTTKALPGSDHRSVIVWLAFDRS